MSEVTPFKIDVSDDNLRDLRDRLQRTRWPDRETVDDSSQVSIKATGSCKIDGPTIDIGEP